MTILKTTEISNAGKQRLKDLRKAALVIMDACENINMTGNCYCLEHHLSITGLLRKAVYIVANGSLRAGRKWYTF